MEKLDGMTKDIVKDNIEKLKELFPTIVKEDKIDFEELQLILGEDINNKEQYSFVWNGKTEATKLAQKRSTGTLRPCPEESKNWDTTKNIYIEGDNLEVLKLLQSSYNGRIKMIYIDPPYNTGHDFVYKDNFEDNIANYKEVTGQAQKSNADTDGRYHTNWLNMMYPRLKLARTLLDKDGVIFISIDDNEFTNLKKLCDDVFGENNFIGVMPRITKKSGKQHSDTIAKNHDYIFIYARNLYETEFNRLESNGEGFDYSDEYVNERGKYKLNQTLDYDSLWYNPTMDFEIKVENQIFYAGGDRSKHIARHQGNHNAKDWVWRWSQAKFDFGYKNGFVVIKEGKDRPRIYTKTYMNATIDKDSNGNYYVKYTTRDNTISSLKLTENEFSNDNAKKDLAEIIEPNYFDFPKPVSLIKQFIDLTCDNDDIVLDFFSGSATTAQSVMEYNLEKDAKIKYICVQLPEKVNEDSKAYIDGYKNICEIGKERIRRAGEKLQREFLDNFVGSVIEKTKPFADDEEISSSIINKEYSKAESNFKKMDIGFKVFKLDSSNLKKWNNTPTKDADEVAKRIQMSMDYLEKDRTELDLVYEIMLKYGIDLTLPINKTANEKAYIVNGDEYKLLVCSQSNLTLEDVEEFANESVGTYLFADRCFSNDNLLINTQEILKAKNKEMRLF